MKWFSVLLGCYGDYPEYSVRAITSVCRARNPSGFDIHVGCNACGPTTVEHMRSRLDRAEIDSLIESRENINKDPMMRLLIDLVTTPYLLWVDDDTHVMNGWDQNLFTFIESNHNKFDCAGHVFYSHRSPEYQAFLATRPWWLGADHYLESCHHERVWFPTGGFWLARADFLRAHNYPDRQMIKKQDDLLLGDLISQHNGRLVSFPREIMDCVKISDGRRRGVGEGHDGWCLTR